MDQTNSMQPNDFSTDMLRMSIDTMTGNMRFYAIMSIVYGVITCLTIIGLPFGIPIIFSGIHLRESADHFKTFSNTKNMGDLKSAFDRQNKFFFIYKVLTIIYLALTVLYVIFIIIMIIASSGELFETFLNANSY